MSWPLPLYDKNATIFSLSILRRQNSLRPTIDAPLGQDRTRCPRVKAGPEHPDLLGSTRAGA
jgi:hypothetical protein